MNIGISKSLLAVQVQIIKNSFWVLSLIIKLFKTITYYGVIFVTPCVYLYDYIMCAQCLLLTHKKCTYVYYVLFNYCIYLMNYDGFVYVYVKHDNYNTKKKKNTFRQKKIHDRVVG